MWSRESLSEERGPSDFQGENLRRDPLLALVAIQREKATEALTIEPLMISWARGAPSAGGAGSGARFRSVAADAEGEDLCKLGGAGTADDVVVTFGLLWRGRGELASEDGDVAVGRARSGETAASRECKKGEAIPLRRRR